MFNRNQDKGFKSKLIHSTGFLDFLNPSIQELVGPSDLIIFQRNIVDQHAHNAIQYWLGQGKPMAVDLDDAYHILPWSNPAHRFWIEREDVYEEQKQAGAALRYLEEGLRKIGALIAPNRNLLADWSHVCRGYYLQNYAETDWWTNLPGREELKEKRGLQDAIVIGWGGSVSHYDSWEGSGIYEAAARICKRHSNVVWAICGNDRRIYDHLPVPADQKQHWPGVPAEEWPRNVQTFDIGVAPLFGIYDQRRSWIKGIEYSLAACPWVGTAGEVYSDVADTGVLVSIGADSWEAALERKITNLKTEQELMAMRLPEFRERFLVDNNLHIYEQVYKQIIADYQAERTPMLPGVMKVG